MTTEAEIESLVLEHLRHIRADIADIKRDVTANSLQLSAIGQQLAGLTEWRPTTEAAPRLFLPRNSF